jgi:hypothetical protein
MADFDNNNRGVLFKNAKKTTDKHPDYTGSCEVNGQEMWLSAWIKTSTKDSSKFMSLQFQAKEAAPAKAKPAVKEGSWDDVDSDLPF